MIFNWALFWRVHLQTLKHCFILISYGGGHRLCRWQNSGTYCAIVLSHTELMANVQHVSIHDADSVCKIKSSVLFTPRVIHRCWGINICWSAQIGLIPSESGDRIASTDSSSISIWGSTSCLPHWGYWTFCQWFSFCVPRLEDLVLPALEGSFYPWRLHCSVVIRRISGVWLGCCSM